jgi:hypothetical protein
MFQETSTGVIHNSVACMRRGYGGGFRDELVTQSHDRYYVVASAFTWD